MSTIDGRSRIALFFAVEDYRMHKDIYRHSLPSVG